MRRSITALQYLGFLAVFGAFLFIFQVESVRAQTGDLIEAQHDFAAGNAPINGDGYSRQAFTLPVANVTITEVALRVRTSTPSSKNWTILIRQPSGNTLCSHTQSMASVSTAGTGTWFLTAISDCPEIAGGTVWIEVRCPSCTSGEALNWRISTSPDMETAADPIVRELSTNAGGSWNSVTGQYFAFQVYGTVQQPPTPTPTPTPLPTPTATPHARTPVSVAESDVETADCLVTYHPDFPTVGRLFIQPFQADITAQTASVTLRLSRVGVPVTPLLVSLVTLPESGTPTADEIQILATGSVTAGQLGVNATTRTISFSPNPSVIAEDRYGILIGAFTSVSDHYCIWGEADTAEDFYESNDEGETWYVGPEQYDSFTASYVVNGFTFESGYFPSNPAQEEPAPNAPDAYETYIWSWTNAYINTPLAYEFATVTTDSTFIVRRLNESGSPVQNLGSYTVTSATPFFVHETVNQSPGPFEVFDSTNNRRLVKHYLLPEPPNAFKDNRPHRADADFSIGHGDIVYRTPATSSARQHNAANPLLSIQRFGTYTFLHYRIPDLEDPQDVFLSVRDANSLAELIRVSIEDLARYNNWDNGGNVANFNDDIYFQNFVVLNTNGNNLPFVQNFNLLSIVGATLEQGTYNYALVDEDNVVLSEGESILIVLNDPLNPWALSANKSRYVLGETARYTFTQRFEELFSVWNNFIFESCCGEIPDFVDDTYQQTQTLSFTHPETWPNPLPATILTFIRVAPSSLPYAADPVVYAFNYNVFYELLGACNVQCRIETWIPADDRFIFSLLLMIALGITAIRIPVPIVGVLEVILFAGLAVLSWIPETAVIVIAVLLVLVALVAYLIRGTGGA